MGLMALGHVLITIPVTIIKPLMTCAVEKRSSQNKTASMELSRGMSVPKRAALPAPIF